MIKLLLLSALLIFACSSNEAVLQDSITLNSFNRNPAPLYILDGVITSTLDSVTPRQLQKYMFLKEKRQMTNMVKKANTELLKLLLKKQQLNHRHIFLLQFSYF